MKEAEECYSHKHTYFELRITLFSGSCCNTVINNVGKAKGKLPIMNESSLLFLAMQTKLELSLIGQVSDRGLGQGSYFPYVLFLNGIQNRNYQQGTLFSIPIGRCGQDRR